jgi:hypothetical protein
MKKDDTGGSSTSHGRFEKPYKGLVAKPKVTRLFERPRRRQKNNIRIDLRKTGAEDVD